MLIGRGEPYSNCSWVQEFRFQYAIVKRVLCRNWVFGPCYVNNLAFRGVEFHVHVMTPAFKVVKILLENL